MIGWIMKNTVAVDLLHLWSYLQSVEARWTKCEMEQSSWMSYCGDKWDRWDKDWVWGCQPELKVAVMNRGMSERETDINIRYTFGRQIRRWTDPSIFMSHAEVMQQFGFHVIMFIAHLTTWKFESCRIWLGDISFQCAVIWNVWNATGRHQLHLLLNEPF